MAKRPAITVLMASFNVERYIGEAIDSVLRQSFHDFELLIIDASTDGTWDIIRSFNDSRIVARKQQSKGLSEALNEGLALASAPCIARFDADDICYPYRLETQYRFLSNNPDYIVISCAADYVDEGGNAVFTNYPPAYTDEAIRKVQLRSCPFIHSGVMYRKEAVLRQGGYDPHAHSFEDHMLWLRLSREGRFFNFSEPLIRVRLNPGSVTIDERWRPARFHRIKKKALRTGSIEHAESEALLSILRLQNTEKIKEGAYHTLLAKKFLWNNHQPANARANIRKVWQRDRFRWDSYFLFLLSFLPGNLLRYSYVLLKGDPATRLKNQRHGH